MIKPPSLFRPINYGSPLLNGMIAYYLFEQGSGRAAYDYLNPSLTSRAGSLVNNVIYNKMQGLLFNQVDSYVQLGFGLDLSFPFTIMVFERYTTDGDGAYFSTVNYITGGDGDLIRSLSGGGVRIFSGGVSADFAIGRTPNKLQVIAYTNTAISGGGAGTQNVFLDGVKIASASLSRSTTNNHNATLGVASALQVGGSWWGGTMSQLLIFNRVLDDFTIRMISANPYSLLQTTSYNGYKPISNNQSQFFRMF